MLVRLRRVRDAVDELHRLHEVVELEGPLELAPDLIPLGDRLQGGLDLRLAHLLDARGVAVRTGHHCAQPLLNRLGISGTVRASFYIYNTMQDADEFLTHVREILERFA